MAAGNEGTIKYCDKGDTEFVLGDLEFALLTIAGVVESVDLIMDCVWSVEEIESISPRLSASIIKTFNNMFADFPFYTVPVRESCS